MMISDWNDFVWNPSPKTKCLPMPIEEEIALWKSRERWKAATLTILSSIMVAVLLVIWANAVRNYNNGGEISVPTGELPAIYSTPEPSTTPMVLKIQMNQISDNKVICPECKKQGLKSTVTWCGSTSTLLATVIQYDEEGNQKPYHDPNITWQQYRCSNGHTFGIPSTR